MTIASFGLALLAASSTCLSASPGILDSDKPPYSFQVAMMDDMEMGGMGASKPGKNMSSDAMPNSGTHGAMSDKPSSGMDMMGKMRGSMAGQQGMGKKMPISSLPGFPGASHLYHIGVTGFFLDHPQHITLTVAQQKSLNRIKEKAMLDQANGDRRIEDIEQELWVLTSADTPDASKIEAKIQAIEKLRSNQRMSFIRSVGEAAKVLSPEQRSALLGNGPASIEPPAGQNAPMKDM